MQRNSRVQPLRNDTPASAFLDRSFSTNVRSWALIWLICVFGPSLVFASAKPAASAPSSEPPWLEKTSYPMPFKNRAEWLAFMAKEVSPAEVAALGEAYPEDEFAGFVDTSLAAVYRVSFHSGKLILRGILPLSRGSGNAATIRSQFPPPRP